MWDAISRNLGLDDNVQPHMAKSYNLCIEMISLANHSSVLRDYFIFLNLKL